jgi:hypothetical protein
MSSDRWEGCRKGFGGQWWLGQSAPNGSISQSRSPRGSRGHGPTRLPRGEAPGMAYGSAHHDADPTLGYLPGPWVRLLRASPTSASTKLRR